MNARFFKYAMFCGHLLGSLATASAQEQVPGPRPEPPAPPYLKPAPDPSQWTVQFSSTAKTASSDKKDDQKKAEPVTHQVNSVSVTRTSPYRVVVIEYAQGDRDELWSDGSVLIEVANSADPKLAAIAPKPTVPIEQYQHADFPDFAWVSKATYIDTQKVGDRSYLVFREDVSTQSGAADVEPATAWIDAETRLPVVWKRGKDVRKVVFASPPDTLTLPPKVADLATRMKRLKQVNSMKAPGGG